MSKERKREGRVKMMRSEKPVIKRKEVVKEEDPDTKAFKKYIGDIDQMILEQEEARLRRDNEWIELFEIQVP